MHFSLHLASICDVNNDRMALSGTTSPGRQGKHITPVITILPTGCANEGSGLWSIIQALWAVGKTQCIEFFGIDPKRAELGSAHDAFRRIEFEHEGAEALLLEIVEEMDRRKQEARRSFTASPEKP